MQHHDTVPVMIMRGSRGKALIILEAVLHASCQS